MGVENVRESKMGGTWIRKEGSYEENEESEECKGGSSK